MLLWLFMYQWDENYKVSSRVSTRWKWMFHVKHKYWYPLTIEITMTFLWNPHARNRISASQIIMTSRWKLLVNQRGIGKNQYTSKDTIQNNIAFWLFSQSIKQENSKILKTLIFAEIGLFWSDPRVRSTKILSFPFFSFLFLSFPFFSFPFLSFLTSRYSIRIPKKHLCTISVILVCC